MGTKDYSTKHTYDVNSRVKAATGMDVNALAADVNDQVQNATNETQMKIVLYGDGATVMKCPTEADGDDELICNMPYKADGSGWRSRIQPDRTPYQGRKLW